MSEDVAVGEMVQSLQIVNKDENDTVECYWIGGNNDDNFELHYDPEQPSCDILVKRNLDREETERYRLGIRVDYRQSRRKRQGEEIQTGR